MTEMVLVRMSERRAHPRVSLSEMLYFSYDSGGTTQFGVGRMIDLSPAGARFETQDPQEFAGPIKLWFVAPGKLQGKLGVEVRVRTEPVWRNAGCCAVKFKAVELCLVGHGVASELPRSGTYCDVVA